MEKYGFIYIWFDKKQTRYYVGSHWGTVDDGYICSSTWMKQAYRIRPKDFKRRILKTNILKKDISFEEHYWLQMMKLEELGSRYYNLKNHRFGHWSQTKNIEPWNKGKRGYSLHSQEYKDRLSIEMSGENNFFFNKRPPCTIGMLGKKHSEATKKKMSDRAPWNKGLKASEDVKKKKAEAMKIKWQDPEYRSMILKARKK